MIRQISLLVLLLISMPLYAGDITYKSGLINLTKVQADGDADLILLPLGKTVVGKLKLYHQVKNELHLVNGNAEFKNPSDQPLYVVYYLALFDKRNRLVASTGGDLTLEVGTSIHEFASALMPLPQSQIEQVGSYQVVMYESTKKIGA